MEEFILTTRVGEVCVSGWTRRNEYHLAYPTIPPMPVWSSAIFSIMCSGGRGLFCSVIAVMNLMDWPGTLLFLMLLM